MDVYDTTHAGEATQSSSEDEGEDHVSAPSNGGVEGGFEAEAPPQHPPKKSELRTTDANTQDPVNFPQNGSFHGSGDDSAPLVVDAVLPDRPGSTAGPGPGSQNGKAANGARNAPKRTKVQMAERLGMYSEPSSSFPAVLPSDSADAVGPTPNLMVDTDGLQRRVPNSLIDLIEEMEEANLKNPSDALLVRLWPRLVCKPSTASASWLA